MTHPKIEIRNLEDLTIHPALKTQPRLADDELLAWRKGMKRRGEAATPPIYITGDHQIVDGRHRYWCARKLGWKTIPVQIVPEEEVMNVIFETLLHRRHLTPGQRAYVIAEHLDEAFEEARRRKLANLNNRLGEAERNSVPFCKTSDDWAAEIGVSVRYLRDARKIYDYYAAMPEKRTFTDDDGKKHKDVTAREYFEPRMMAEETPVGLGAVIAGLGFLTNVKDRWHSGGRPQETQKQFDLFSKLVTDEDNRWEYWQKFDAETRAEHFAEVRNKAAQLPPEVCRERAEYHEKLADQFRKAAKGGRQ